MPPLWPWEVRGKQRQTTSFNPIPLKNIAFPSASVPCHLQSQNLVLYLVLSPWSKATRLWPTAPPSLLWASGCNLQQHKLWICPQGDAPWSSAIAQRPLCTLPISLPFLSSFGTCLACCSPVLCILSCPHLQFPSHPGGTHPGGGHISVSTQASTKGAQI